MGSVVELSQRRGGYRPRPKSRYAGDAVVLDFLKLPPDVTVNLRIRRGKTIWNGKVRVRTYNLEVCQFSMSEEYYESKVIPGVPSTQEIKRLVKQYGSRVRGDGRLRVSNLVSGIPNEKFGFNERGDELSA